METLALILSIVALIGVVLIWLTVIRIAQIIGRMQRRQRIEDMISIAGLLALVATSVIKRISNRNAEE